MDYLITQKDARFIKNYERFLIIRYYFSHISIDKANMIVRGFSKMADQFKKSAKMIGKIWREIVEEHKDVCSILRDK